MSDEKYMRVNQNYIGHLERDIERGEYRPDFDNVIQTLIFNIKSLWAENAELKARLIEGVRGASIDKKIYDDFPEPKPQGEE